MSNENLFLGDAIDRVIEALYDIWGVSPGREQSTYIYQPDPHPIATAASADASATGTFQVTPSGAFVLTKHAVHVTDNSHASQRDVYFTWESTSSDRRFSNDTPGGHVENVGGSDEFPFLYPVPYLIDTSATISIRIQNIQAAIRWAYVSFVGYRIWNVRALNLTRRSG